jgi:hypothetical protein
MPGPTDLQDLAVDFLQALVDSLDAIPDADPALAGAPARAFVNPGVPVWDCCEQLVVYDPSIGEQSTSPTGPGASSRRHVFGRIPMVRLVGTITRCQAQGTVVGKTYVPPSPDVKTAESAQHHADGWAIHNGIFNRLGQGLLGGGRCSEAQWEGMEAVTPAGGCGGWTVTIRFQLDGYGYATPIAS